MVLEFSETTTCPDSVHCSSSGVEIGASGIGMGDDFQFAQFTISHSSQSLDLSLFSDRGGELAHHLKYERLLEKGALRLGFATIGDIDADDVAVPEDVVVVGDAVADDLVDRGAHGLGESLVVERRRGDPVLAAVPTQGRGVVPVQLEIRLLLARLGA